MSFVYLVGKHIRETNDGSVWEVQGIFDDIDKAEDVCNYDNYFIGQCELNKPFPDELCEFPVAYYPRLEERPEPLK